MGLLVGSGGVDRAARRTDELNMAANKTCGLLVVDLGAPASNKGSATRGGMERQRTREDDGRLCR